jgi:hypothetical protein
MQKSPKPLILIAFDINQQTLFINTAGLLENFAVFVIPFT